MSKSPSPRRVQRKRTKGWKMPPNTVYVGRPSKWGNPYKVGERYTKLPTTGEFEGIMLTMNLNETCRTPEEAVTLFRELSLQKEFDRVAVKSELQGKNLSCWCPLDKPCHADVLLEVANA